MFGGVSFEINRLTSRNIPGGIHLPVGPSNGVDIFKTSTPILSGAGRNAVIGFSNAITPVRPTSQNQLAPWNRRLSSERRGDPAAAPEAIGVLWRRPLVAGD